MAFKPIAGPQVSPWLAQELGGGMAFQAPGQALPALSGANPMANPTNGPGMNAPGAAFTTSTGGSGPKIGGTATKAGGDPSSLVSLAAFSALTQGMGAQPEPRPVPLGRVGQFRPAQLDLPFSGGGPGANIMAALR